MTIKGEANMWKQEYLKPMQFESDEPEPDVVMRSEAIKNESIEQITVATGNDIRQRIARDQRYMP